MAYNPNQPRVPKGHSNSGEWTRGDYGARTDSYSDSDAGSDSSPDSGSDAGSVSDWEPDHPNGRQWLPGRQYALLGPALAAGARAGLGLFGIGRGLRPFLPEIEPPLPLPPPEPSPGADGQTIKELTDGLALYARLSAHNTADRRAVALFNARIFPNGKRGLDLASVRTLSRKEVKGACKALDLVQRLTDEAVAFVGPRRGHSPADYGTYVHHQVHILVQMEGDTNLKSEESVEKAKEEDAEGWIRIDVYEWANDEIICIYDIKTGKSGLSYARMWEIARTIAKKYRSVRFIILTEVRPTIEIRQ